MKKGTYICLAPLGPIAAVTIKYEYFPGSPGRMYLDNGDPGYPDEPAEVNIIEVFVAGQTIDGSEFPDVWIEKLQEHILEKHDEMISNQMAERAEREREDDQPS